MPATGCHQVISGADGEGIRDLMVTWSPAFGGKCTTQSRHSELREIRDYDHTCTVLNARVNVIADVFILCFPSLFSLINHREINTFQLQANNPTPNTIT